MALRMIPASFMLLAMLGVLLPGSLSYSFAATASVYRLTADFGVPCDIGPLGPDVSNAINSAIATVPSGATIVLECFYHVGRSIVVNRSSLRLTGVQKISSGLVRYTQPELPLLERPTGYPFITTIPRLAPSVTNVEFRNFTIKGSLTSAAFDRRFESVSGFVLERNIQNVAIENVDVFGVHGDFLYINGARDVTVRNLYGRIAGRQAFTPNAGERITVTNSKFEQIARSGLNAETLFLPLRDLLVEDVEFRDYNHCGIGLHAYVPSNPPPIERVTMRRVRLTGGLCMLGIDPPAGAVYQGFHFEDVSYEGNREQAITIKITDAVADITIIRMTASFRSNHQAYLGGKGTRAISDSKFQNFWMTVPACHTQGWSVINNGGLGSCK